MTQPLTPRQQAFVDHYLVSGNATRAAIAAGYSKRAPRRAGSALLDSPAVSAAIRAAMAARSERTNITADRVLVEMARIAFSDIGRVARWGNDGLELKASDEIEPEDRVAIAEVWAARGESGAPRRIKLHDKQRALLGLTTHLGLFGPHALSAARGFRSPSKGAAEVRAMLEERFSRILNRQREEQEKEAEAERQLERRWEDYGESFGYHSTPLIEGPENDAGEEE